MSGVAANLQQYLSSGSLLAYPAAFISGLLISFTPCVYPVKPIQLGFIGGQTATARGDSGGRVRLRGFTLSVMFVTGMSIIYAALGAFASLTGTLFGIWSASPWAYIVVSQIVLLSGISMLDVFQLPTLQVLASWDPQREGRGYLSAGLLGASSGLMYCPLFRQQASGRLCRSAKPVTR